jgi:hypothetical protein
MLFDPYSFNLHAVVGALKTASACLPAACVGPSHAAEEEVQFSAARFPMSFASGAPTVVLCCNEIATASMGFPAARGGTADERQPAYALDRATVHGAKDDAVVVIGGVGKAMVAMPKGPMAVATQEAAAKSCAAGAMAQSLQAFFGTDAIRFDFGRIANRKSLNDGSTKELGDDVAMVRVVCAMHCRFSAGAGGARGRIGDRRAAAQAFQLC